MKIYKHVNEISDLKYPVVTIGGFDGLHAGHKVIIDKLVKAAHKQNGDSVVITFSPHPRIVLFNDIDFKLLTTDEEKISILDKLGVDHLIFYPFSEEFSKLSSDSFIKNILVDKLHAKKLVIGYDHHFGNKRSGNLGKLMDYGKIYDFDIEEIPQQQIAINNVQNISVSSTNIRKALFSGNIPLANLMLGYSYNLTGKVVQGDKIGKKIGFPTANIEIADKNKLIPSFGVYAVRAEINSKPYNGMLYIGTRPTLPSGKFTVEVNLFDFDKNIYNENITVYFIEKVRGDIKFDNIEALKNQISNDKITIKEVLAKNKFDDLVI